MKNIKNLANESASRTGRDVGQVGQVRRVGVRAAQAEMWAGGIDGAGGMRGLWGERIGERRVNDIYFL